MTQIAISNNTAFERNYPFITAILFWCGIVVVSSVYLTIPLAGIFNEAFEATASQVAWTSSAFSLFYAIGCLFTGPLSDRYGRKRVILFGFVALTMITGVLGLSNSLSTFIIFRSLQGIAAATFPPVAVTYIVEMFPPEKRVTTIGFVSSGFLMAGVVGQIFSSFFSNVYGWQSVFYIIGLIYLLTTIIVALFIPKVDNQNHSSNLLAPFKQFGSVLTIKPLLFCYLIATTLLLTFVGMYTALGNYLSIEFGLGNQDIFFVRTVGIIGMLFSLFTGKLVNKFGILTILRVGLTLAFVGLAVLGISSNLSMLTIMSVIFVTGIAITVPTLISLVGQLGDQARGAAVSLYTFVVFIGASLGPIVAEVLLNTGSYLLTFEILALLIGIGLFASFLIKPSIR
ncbi:MFS transporter [Halalkalibacter lacteus]|uniref:MFS transporter n=1 Tax=Halalkalibacter lacteus TaxID=3090663 RepID=UPI002FC7EDE7